MDKKEMRRNTEKIVEKHKERGRRMSRSQQKEYCTSAVRSLNEIEKQLKDGTCNYDDCYTEILFWKKKEEKGEVCSKGRAILERIKKYKLKRLRRAPVYDSSSDEDSSEDEQPDLKF